MKFEDKTPTEGKPLEAGLQLAVDEVKTHHWTKEERRAALMRFLRSRKPNKSSRAARVAKIPDDIAQLLEKDKTKVNHFFDLWCAHGEDWGRVQAFQRRYQRNSSGQFAKQVWRNRSQLVAHFHSEVVADAVVPSRNPLTQRRACPEAVNC